MDLSFSPEEELFRREAREWLNANKPKEKRPRDGAEMRAFDSAWQRKQHEGGWAGIAWPQAYGGRGLSLVQQLIWHEEYARAGAPWVGCMFVGLNHGGPTLIARANEEQKAFHLSRIITGEAIWCQGFSEPGAGSDLAGLQTSAVIDGDHLVVNGSKIWTSFAQVADYQELLMRTNRDVPKHKGLTWAICDMTSPGIEIRPIETLAGHRHFCQVFYTDVRIPLTNVVGQIDDGWSVAMSTLGFERGTAFMAEQVEMAESLEELIDYARDNMGPDGRALIANEDIAHRLATLRAEVTALRSMTYMTVSRILAGNTPGSEGSVVRLFFAEALRRMRRLALDIVGGDSIELDHWSDLYLEGFRYTIAAGTSEIQRNIVGERILGLPRGAAR